MSSRASIVIPAHNEERRISQLLQSLSDPSLEGLYDIYVVCNGCTDNTRLIAENFPGITVVDIESAGKHFALNEGDRLAGDVYPRLYCDADVQISATSIAALVDVLTTEEIRIAGPIVRYGSEESDWAVRMYFRALNSRLMTTWHSEHMAGRGLYGASRAARECFTLFPNVIGDDLFFDSQFELDHKYVVPECVATIWVPTTIRHLIKSEVRVAEGNQQYRAILSGSEGNGSRNHRFELRLASRVRALREWKNQLRVQDIAPLAVYLFISFLARINLTLRKSRGHQIDWR